MWQFATVKWLAIKELTKLKVPAVDKAAMACAYDVDPSWKWQETAYAELGARDEPIQKEEGMRLGLDIVLKLTELRERIRERRNKASSSYIPSPSPGPYCYTRPMSPVTIYLDQWLSWALIQLFRFWIRTNLQVDNTVRTTSRTFELSLSCLNHLYHSFLVTNSPVSLICKNINDAN